MVRRQSIGRMPSEISLIATGGATLQIDNTISEIQVANPQFLGVPAIVDRGPMYTYLGTSNVGDITYDYVQDKFIHRPRIDQNNQGYIHAPSINHATTAAILRAGYHAHGDDNAQLAVNLNSERVRKALFYLEGIRNGQELGALLGYQLERGLRDHGTGQTAQHIFEIRAQYPLVAQRVTGTDGATSIADAEAYNVINGLSLVENSENPATDFPYGVDALMGISQDDKKVIITEVTKLHEALDGINDLLMSESMFQVVQGNFVRASGALNAMSGKGVIDEAQVIKTPRNFNVLTHKFGVQFDLSNASHAIWSANGTPRAILEPNLNHWISTVLPPPASIRINYSITEMNDDGSDGAVNENHLTVSELSIEPIDLFYGLSQSNAQGTSNEFVNRLQRHISVGEASDNVRIEYQFTDRTGFSESDVSIFQLQALVDQLKEVVQNGKAAKAEDFILASGAEETMANSANGGYNLQPLKARVDDILSATMSNGASGLKGLIDRLQAEINVVTTALDGDAYDPDLSPLVTLRTIVQEASFFGLESEVIHQHHDHSLESAEQMIDLSLRVLDEMSQRFTTAEAANNVLNTLSDGEQLSSLMVICQTVFGRNFKVFPEYRFYNDAQLTSALNYPDYLKDAPSCAVEEWVQGLSPVRNRMRAFHSMSLLSETLGSVGQHLELSISQLPLAPIDETNAVQARWLGVAFPKGYDLPDENLSIVMSLPTSYDASQIQAGIIVDQWVEEIPDETAHTGIAVHFNNPDSEPAQTCLLAVSPDLSGDWSWDDLMDTLNETLAWAKKRAVDPDLLNETFYAQVLPATYAAISASDDTPILDYGRNVVPKPKPGIHTLFTLADYEIPAFQSALTAVESIDLNLDTP